MGKFQVKAQKENNELAKKQNPTQSQKDRAKELNDQANEYVKHYQNLLKQKQDKEQDVETRSNKIKEDAEAKKKERKEKAEARKKIREEKQLIAKQQKEEKEKEKS